MADDQFNPWGLTPGQGSMVSAMIKFGHVKVVAARLGISEHTVVDRLRAARRKMKAKHSIQAYILWHEWEQSQDNES